MSAQLNYVRSFATPPAAPKRHRQNSFFCTKKGHIMAQTIRQAKPGDRVKIHFTGVLADGTLFDTTYESHTCEEDNCGCSDQGADHGAEGCGCGGEAGPIELEIGAGQFFPQIEEALAGMTPGDKKTVTIKSADAFGDYDEEQIHCVSRDQFPDNIIPQANDTFELVNDEGEGMVVTVIAADDEGITLDANHPLAGQDLIFELELVEIS